MTSHWRRLVCRGLPTLLLLSLTLGLAGPIQAADINAASCSQSAVQSAINAAVSGDRVIVPAGSCSTWNVSISGKRLTLQGAGIGVTNINGGGINVNASATNF